MWPFIVTDLVLLAVAGWLAQSVQQPLSTGATLGIVACVSLGGLAIMVPFIARFERQKNEALAERQRALEALSRTVAASAEQISIVTGGLHEIAGLVQKNLRQVDELPQKLQDKMTDFQSQLTAANATAADEEKAAVTRERLALRSSESERMESIARQIAQSANTWGALASAAEQQLHAAHSAAAQLSTSAATLTGQSHELATQGFAQAHAEFTRALAAAGESSGQLVALAKTSALAELDARVVANSTEIIERVTTELGASVHRELSTKFALISQAIAEKIDGTAQALEAKLAVSTQRLEEKVVQLVAAAQRVEAPAAFVSGLASTVGATAATPVSTPLDVVAPVASVPSLNELGESAAVTSLQAETALPLVPPLAPKRTRKPRREISVAAAAPTPDLAVAAALDAVPVDASLSVPAATSNLVDSTFGADRASDPAAAATAVDVVTAPHEAADLNLAAEAPRLAPLAAIVGPAVTPDLPAASAETPSVVSAQAAPVAPIVVSVPEPVATASGDRLSVEPAVEALGAEVAAASVPARSLESTPPPLELDAPDRSPASSPAEDPASDVAVNLLDLNPAGAAAPVPVAPVLRAVPLDVFPASVVAAVSDGAPFADGAGLALAAPPPELSLVATVSVASEEPPVATERPPVRSSRPRVVAPTREVDDEPGLGLELDDSSVGSSALASERVMTSDGATRLIVTAYIGIGNRLFIRGEGPSLSWEKGVAMQFVSIGKWRWESNDVTAPVAFKVYKNDDLECTILGSRMLEPGHQHEFSASF
ncbi:MAG: hypothetical protein RL077_3217 [Verrucomicrobiota bacterium]